MISMLIYDCNEKESQELIKYSRDNVALLSDDSLKINSFHKAGEARKQLEKRDLMDGAFLDVTAQEGIELTKETRKAYEMAELLLIADSSVSPMEYMTPAIRASSLLLRPWTGNQAAAVVRDFFRALYRNRGEKEEEKALIVENRQGKMPIPFSKIYYLEVREKKVFVRLKEKEYSKYETLENIAKELPEEFIRCHRSFVVNTAYIDRVKLSENTIYLEDGICVPLSRSYKAVIKEYMNGLRGI